MSVEGFDGRVLIVSFVMSAFAVGILVPWNDPTLIAAVSEGLPGAGRSPYVAAMTRLKVKALPSVVNAGIGESAQSVRQDVLTGSHVGLLCWFRFPLQRLSCPSVST